MISKIVENREEGPKEGSFIFSTSPKILAMMVALLSMGMLEVLAPSIIFSALPGSNIAKLLALAFQELVVGALVLTIIIVLRQDELAATIIVGIHLYVDWYLGLAVVGLIMALVLLLIFFLARSPQHPWGEPRALWLWVLFLVLALFPAYRGAAVLSDALYYYPNIICEALLMFWLGTIIARDAVHIERLFNILAGAGALLAIHTIVQATTGMVLFGSARFNEFLASTASYQISIGSSVHRVGSFFIDPNWNGTFFATMVFLPLGLLVARPSFLEKALYFAEALLMLIALLFTYSTGAAIGACAGLIVFMVGVGRIRYRIQLALFIALVAIVVMTYFPEQVNLQLQHASDPSELLLRVGAWQTAVRVISAFPLTGIGLGLFVYLQRAEPYRVPAQVVPLAHPHNSYLELGAMAGLPILAVFIALLFFALWLALRNWVSADVRTRSALGGGIAAIIALSVNSLSINGWTLPPLAAIGWLILGAISSPLLRKSWAHEMTKEGEQANTHSS